MKNNTLFIQANSWIEVTSVTSITTKTDSNNFNLVIKKPLSRTLTGAKTQILFILSFIKIN